ncbi:MAG: prepilin-type N-terminal cleavage/methylation domain-containing protein [candidate division Zixibacteria bacterium]|nr:prepilin-type N-terminal cleavage/methylation domain-containing protein [candidate division Zixibacteria bacterium]
MKLFRSKRIRNERGFSLIEVMMAAMITGIITTAATRFFADINQNAEAQYEISEIQHMCRVCLDDIKKNLRMAGYLLDDDHPAYAVEADTLMVFYRDTQPVDTIRYFLQPYASDDVQDEEAREIYKLMKKLNSQNASAYADFITAINFVPIDSANMVVTISAETERPDETFPLNGGYREFSLGDRIHMRNMR